MKRGVDSSPPIEAPFLHSFAGFRKSVYDEEELQLPENDRLTTVAMDAAAARARDLEAWRSFVQRPAEVGSIDIDDVPFPNLGDDKPLPGAEDLGLELKLAVRDLQRRWHPDKFLQRFGTSLVPSSRDSILKRVVAIAQALNSIAV